MSEIKKKTPPKPTKADQGWNFVDKGRIQARMEDDDFRVKQIWFRGPIKSLHTTPVYIGHKDNGWADWHVRMAIDHTHARVTYKGQTRCIPAEFIESWEPFGPTTP